MEDVPEPSNYQETLDQLLEFKKLVFKLENELNKKENEKNEYMKLHRELKEFNQKILNQNNINKEEINKLLEEKIRIENQYKNENKILKENLENQKEHYENILNINNQFEERILKNKIESEVENRYNEKLQEKDIEIQNLNERINNLMKENVHLDTEYNEYKNQTKKEIERLNEKYDNDMNDMINKFELYKNNLDNIEIKPKEDELSPLLIQELRIQLNHYKAQVKDLSESKELLKNQNNILLLSNKTKEESLLKTIETEKYNSNLHINQIEQLTEQINNKDNELLDLKNALELAKNGLINLQKEKEDLINANDELNSKINIANNELNRLKNLVVTRDEEINKILLNYRTQNQKKLYDERKNVENYQKEIENLNLNLKTLKAEFKEFIDNTNIEKNQNDKNYQLLVEEKKNLIKRINDLQYELEYIRGDYENKIRSLSHYEKEYYLMGERYRNLNLYMISQINSEQDNNKNNTDKETEIKSLNEYIEKIKNENNIDKYITLKKKNYYKKKYKKLLSILNQINPNERKKIESLIENIKKEDQNFEESQNEGNEDF